MEPRQLRVGAEVSALTQVQDFLSAEAERAGLDAAAAGRLALAAEEVFVNICSYAYPDTPSGWVELSAWVEDACFNLEVRDGGIAFDGPARAAPDLNASLDEREVGGLGWMLVRRMVDGLDYRREDDCNHVRLGMRLGGSASREDPPA